MGTTMRSSRKTMHRGAFLSALLSICLVGQSASLGYAQEAAGKPAYERFEAKPEFAPGSKQYKDMQAAKKEALRGNFDLQAIKAFYQNCVLPQFTSLEDPLAINRVIDAEIKPDIEMAKKLPAANCKAFNDTMYQMMSFIATKNYRPAATINATLVIGMLDEQSLLLARHQCLMQKPRFSFWAQQRKEPMMV